VAFEDGYKIISRKNVRSSGNVIPFTHVLTFKNGQIIDEKDISFLH